MNRHALIKSQDRKRVLLSYGSTSLLYLIVALAFALLGFLQVDEVSEYAGPVLVRLGSPEGVEALPLPARPSVPESGAEQSQPSQSEAQAEEPQAAAIPRAENTAAQAPAQVAAAPPARPIAAPPAPAPPVIKGSEAGNSHETTFEASSGRVGRNLYEPVWLYMPLPAIIDQLLVQDIPATKDGFLPAEDRRKAVEAWYRRDGVFYYRKGEVPLPERPRIWLALQDAGFDLLREADYRMRPGLGPLTLSFRVSGGSAGSPRLDNVRVLTSSGYADIDAAVLYGFSQASFSNASENAVSGRFVYHFGLGR